MKKTILCALFMTAAIAARSGEPFPYSDLLTKTHRQLELEGYRYNAKYNQHSSKPSGMIGEALISGITGVFSDIPSESDSHITIQHGEEGVAWVSMRFHNHDTYIRIVKYLIENDIPYTNVDLTYGSDISYYIDDIQFKLRKMMSIGTTYFRGTEQASYDLYNTYTYSFVTPIPASSPWIEKHRLVRSEGLPSGHIDDREGVDFTSFPAITPARIKGKRWEASYDRGTTSPIRIMESVEFLSAGEFRYVRANETYGTGVDVIYSYRTDGNVIRGEYSRHGDGSVSELSFYPVTIGIAADDTLTLFMPDNSNYSTELYPAESPQ